MTLIGILLSAGLSIFGFWLKWRLGQASKDRLRADLATQEVQDMEGAINALHESEQAHENKVVEIMGGVSDGRLMELLSEPITEAELSDSKPPASQTSIR